MEIIRELVLVLACSVMVVGISSYFKIPGVIGLILSGLILGPSVSGLIKDIHDIQILSEIGIMLLMFTIGLEFSPKKILQLRNEVLGMGGIQVFLTILLLMSALIFFFSFSSKTSFLIGCVVSMSSTALVMKILKEKNRLQTPYGRAMTGILLFQDICVVPFLMIIPVLKNDSVSVSHLTLRILVSITSVIILILVARYIFPKFFKILHYINFQEIFLALILSICFGIALATSSLGFSLSMGSFIAGMLLSETDFIFQIESEIQTLKNLFLSFFFVSVGMLVDLQHLIHHFSPYLLTLTGIILLKTIIISLLALLFRHPFNISVCIGLGLSQIGEFSFIILNEGLSKELISSFQYQNLLGASVISMMITPAFLHLGNHLLKKIDSGHSRISSPDSMEDHVIIAGFGITGQNISRILKNFEIPYVIIEINPRTVRDFRKKGEPIFFGDITNPRNLQQLGVDKANMMVMALSDWDASIRAVHAARRVNPLLKIIVRTEYVRQIEPLYEAGANIVVSQEFESSLEMAYHVLKTIGVPEFLAHYNSRQLRRKHYAFFTSEFTEGNPVRLSRLREYSCAMDIFMVPETDDGVILPAEKLEMEKYQCTLLAVIGKENVIKDPSPDTLLYPGDLVVIYGKSEHIESAFENALTYFRKKENFF